MLYSKDGSFPAPLPFRIVLPNGRTRTDPTSFTIEEINEAGYTAVIVPQYNPLTERLTWDGILLGVEVIPPPLPTPNWPAFNLAISMDSIMIQYEVAANQVHPSIVSKKDLAYSIIQDKGLDNFAAIFPIFCQIANVAQQHRDDWADLALQYDLPAEFVTIVRGY